MPAGFCVTLFADSLGAARHMEVAPNGDVIVAVRATRNAQGPVPGGIIVLRDENADGKADTRTRFGSFSATEVRLLGNALYTYRATQSCAFRGKRTRWSRRDRRIRS